MFGVGLIVGLFAGTFIGVIVSSLCVAASRKPDEGLTPDDEVGVWKLEKWNDYAEK